MAGYQCSVFQKALLRRGRGGDENSNPIALIDFDITPRDPRSQDFENQMEVHTEFLQSNPQNAMPTAIVFEGYNTLAIIANPTSHYTCYMHDLKADKWIYFDSRIWSYG